jgi:WD40 repeat protein/energy-coupling factor transporter ATP-binding protein EcfA2
MARYALIIGIAEYMGSFKSLETPVQNANAIAEILDRYGDFNQVKRLPFRREAGQKNLGTVIRKPLPHATLVQELQQFLQDANGSDVLLYYSGHGFTKLDPLSNTPEGFLAPSDCQVELNAAGQIVAEKNGISLAGLNALINQHTFNSLVVILDCCNAGAFLETSMVRRDVTAFGYERDYYLITACRSSSKAYEGEEYSLLTAAVLKGLSQTNAAPESGRISGDRLFDAIGNELQNSRQEPIRMGWGRLITLVRYLQPPQSSESVTQSFNPANPYMGLKPFEREQAEYFFGREQAVRALLDRLAENRFLAVIGPSGCGKSSLVKAGLLPELERDRIPGSRDWQVEIITPGQYPLQALTNALERHRSDAHPLVLFVDQFEELFTLCLNEEEQRTFIKRLDQETNDPNRQTRIIIALRGDFLDRCAKFQESADLINTTAPTTYIVTPLTEAKLVAELEESITCPAALHGVSFEQGLVARIVDDVINQPGAMPLLQYALTQLWDTCISPNGTSRSLTIQSYDTIEGVKGALQRWADQFYTNLSPKDQAFVQEMVGEMVQLGDEGEVTRRRAPWERLRELASSQEQLDRIIGRLVYQRLLVADDKTVEVAHEALLSESRLIQGWIEENRESIRLQQRLEVYRREWEEHNRSEDHLLDAGRLAAVDEWLERTQPRLMGVDQEFIGKSRKKRDQEFRSQLEQERRLREGAEQRELAEIEKKLEAEARAKAEREKIKEAEARIMAEKREKRIAVLAGLFAVSSVALSSLIQLNQIQLKQEEALAASNLIGQAEQLLKTHNELEAIQTSIFALQKLKSIRRETPSEIQKIQTILSSTRERNRIQAHKAGVRSIDVSPNGRVIISGGKDSKIRIWNLDKKTISSPIAGHKDFVSTVKFSPDGKKFASGSYDGTIKLWTQEGDLIHSLRVPEYIYDMSFSKDGRELAIVGNSRTIKIWNLVNYSSYEFFDKALPQSPDYRIRSIDFNPNNGRDIISSGFSDYEVIRWSLGKENGYPKQISKTNLDTLSVRFNKSGNMFLSSSDGGWISIRDINGNLIGKIVDDNKEPIRYAKFSPDDQFIVSINSGSIIKLWKLDTALELWQKSQISLSKPAEKINANNGSINYFSFLSTEDSHLFIAIASEDGTVRLLQASKEQNRENNIAHDRLDNLMKKACALLEDYSKSNSASIELACSRLDSSS